MEIFQKNKTYKVKIKNSNQKIQIYTATIIEEDSNFVKFRDRDNNEIIVNKVNILEVQTL